MKRNFKTGLRALGSLALAVSLLTACGGNSPAGTGNGQGNTPQSGASGSPAAPEKRGSISVTVYDRGTVPASEGTIEKNRWTQWINDNGPVDVAFVAIPRNESAEKLNTLFASGTAPDLVLEYAPNIKNALYLQKQLMPVEEIIEQYSTTYKELMAEYPALRKAGLMADGEMYQFGKINEVVPIKAILIRQDWLEVLNLKVPETTEELYEVARDFAKEDPDNNGQQDTYGIALSHLSGGTFAQIYQNMTGWAIVNNEMVRTWDNMKAETTMRKRFYEEGIVDRDYLNDKNGAKAKQDFVNGKLGIYPGQFTWASFAVNELTTLKENVPNAKVIPIQLPESEFGVFNPTLQNPIQMTAVVNANAKDPEAVMKYVDFAASDTFGWALRYGIEGEHYEKNDQNLPVIGDQEKFKTEVGWAGDFNMLFTTLKLGEAGLTRASFDLSVPVQKEGYELFERAKSTYMDTSVTLADITHSEHMPQLPQELQTLSANLDYSDILIRAITGGTTYTVDQAMADVRDFWIAGGGEEVEEWYKNWYRENKDSAFLAGDIYDIVEQQKQAGY